MIDRLRELLRAATPGPWYESVFIDSPRYDHMDERWKDEKRLEENRIVRGGPRHNPVAIIQQSVEDRAYIAACDPDTIRELLDAHDRMAGALHDTMASMAFLKSVIASGEGLNAQDDARLAGVFEAARAALAVPKEENPE